MSIKVWVIDKKAEKYKKIILEKARLVASFLSLNGCLEIFLVGDKQMKKNVLSYVEEKKDSFPRPDLKEKYLGEIHLNISHINKKKEDFLFMLFHGILHIAGYDHKQKNDKIRMEYKEKIIFSKFGL
ncbi:rRNA maturation RNAse YbeY [Patescibacteria group bacterium]|nr:rRNA maturation RNAse YbeY [Patescibacteria group bacterium]